MTLAAELAARYDCRTVCITAGAEGAWLRRDDRTYHAPAPRVRVVDTIGAGDAFTAALLAGIVRGGAQPDWAALLARACKLGAWVASQAGAQPVYRSDDVLGADALPSATS